MMHTPTNPGLNSTMFLEQLKQAQRIQRTKDYNRIVETLRMLRLSNYSQYA